MSKIAIAPLLAAFATAAHAQVCQWSTDFYPGDFDAGVTAIANFDDGSGLATYAAGWFTTAGGVDAMSLAKWDGASWSQVGGGLNAGLPRFVSNLLPFDDGSGFKLFVVGSFDDVGGQPANGIATWDGSTLAPLIPPFDPVSATAHNDGTGPALFFSGNAATRGVYKWDGSSFTALPGDFQFAPSTLLSVVGHASVPDGLYAGGGFTTIDGSPVNRLARWDGASWAEVPGWTGGTILTMYFDPVAGGSGLVLGGSDPVDSAKGYLASWNGVGWDERAYPGGRIQAIVPFLAGLPFGQIVGGFGVDGANDLYLCDVLSVTPLGFDIDGNINTLIGDLSTEMLAGGTFLEFGGANAARLAHFINDGNGFRPLGNASVGNSPTSTSNAMTTWDPPGAAGPQLVIGGSMVSVGPLRANRVAAWDGAAWSALGGGVVGSRVSALAAFDVGVGMQLFVGGLFDAPGVNIAAWDGAAWQALGTGLDGACSAILGFDDGSGFSAYVGGFFTAAGGVAASNIARWNGVAWSSVGAGLPSSCRSLAAFDDGGGEALFAATSQLHRWDGAAWSIVTGAPSGINVLRVIDGELYVGGSFTEVDGLTVNGITKWDGVAWSAIGQGFDGSVSDIRRFNDGAGCSIYAVGSFETLADGTPARHIARWDGAGWSEVEDGLSRVYFSGATVLGELDGDLYVAGDFRKAGNVPSGRIARLGCTPLPSCTGDLDFDGDIDAADALILANRLQGPGVAIDTECVDADLDGDTDADMFDLAIMQELVGAACP